MGKTTDLWREIKRVFIPHVEARGFQLDQRYAPNFLEFRRIAGDRLHVFEIQWEKYGRRRFVVNYGSCSADGAEFGGTVIPAAEAGPAQCRDFGRLKPGKGGTVSSWFRQDKPFPLGWFSSSPLYPPGQVVGQLMELFDELETYWAEGTIGSHMSPLGAPVQRDAAGEHR